MATTEFQIDEMRSMCKKLEGVDTVVRAHVDDWGRYGNFTIMVTPDTHDRHTSRRLAAIVKRELPPGAHIRQYFGPDPIRERRWAGKVKTVGYSRTFWVFDVDFQTYDPESNRFNG